MMKRTFLVLLPMIVVFTLHVIGGAFFGIYDRWPESDNILHFLGGVSTAVSALLAQRWGEERQTIPLIRGSLRIFLGVAVVALVAVLWESAEFAGDHLVPGAKFQDGLLDTMLDLAMGLTGAVMVFLIVEVREQPGRSVVRG